MFRPFFGPFLGTLVKKLKQEKVAPGIYHYLGPQNSISQKKETLEVETLNHIDEPVWMVSVVWMI